MLGVFAEFETNLRRERQLEGIQQAKAKGVYKGRKPSIDITKVKALRDAGKGPRDYRQGAEDGALFGVPCAGGCGARGWVKLTNAQANGCPLTLMRPFSPPTPATPARSAPRARPERWSLALRI